MIRYGAISKWLNAPYDLSVIKRLEHPLSLEILLRVTLLMVGAIMLWLTRGYEGLGTLVMVYLCGLVVYSIVLISVPTHTTRRYALLVGLAGLGFMACYFGAAVWLWQRGDAVGPALAAMMLMGTMFNALTERVVDLVTRIVDVISVFAFLLLLTGVFVWGSYTHNPVEGLLLMSMWFLAVYFLKSLFEVLRWRAELHARRRVEAESERLRSLGQLTSGVAHDFNNLLTVILGNIDLMREVSNPSEQDELRREVQSAANRAADMVGHLLAFSRKSDLRPETMTIGALFDSVSPLLKRLLPATHSVEPCQTNALPSIFVDPKKLSTALLNIVLNSRDAMPSGGKIKLDAWESNALGMPSVSIRIRDQGEGIPPEEIDKVFEPFFTTKPVGEGSGLGLPMARGFVEQSGGQLEIKSKPGKGTAVTMHFPAHTS